MAVEPARVSQLEAMLLTFEKVYWQFIPPSLKLDPVDENRSQNYQAQQLDYGEARNYIHY